MMIRGRVQNGVVVLDTQAGLPEGVEVTIEPLPPRSQKGNGAKQPTVGRALASLAGKAKGLPTDAAKNLDHYLYGHAKR